MDTSVVIAWLSSSDAHHSKAREAMKAARLSADIGIPAVVFSEALVWPYQQNRAAEGVRILLSLGEILPVTADIARVAAQLRAKSTLRPADALIIATGIVLDAQEILTFDKKWESLDTRVRCL